MKRVIKASIANEDEILELLDTAADVLKGECEARGQDEYIDDLKWGKDRFEIPIFVFNSPKDTHEVAKFTFVYDPDDDYTSMEDQMHVRLDEFIQDWNRSDEDDYTGDDYIEDALDDATFTVLEKYRNKKSQDEIVSLIKRKLKSSFNLTEGEDFTTNDILEVINDYAHYWEY